MIKVSVPEGIWGENTEGAISTWLYNSGEHVTEGQVICELMSEKTVFELEAPASGKLEVLVDAEMPVKVSDHIATIHP